MSSSPIYLQHYEQQVNDRRMTSPPPSIDDRLLPENSVSVPLAWRKIPRQNVEVFSSKEKKFQPLLPFLLEDACVLMPIHPLSEHRYHAEKLIYSGHIQFSASYRTVFFEPESGGLLCNWIPAGMTLMFKLGLEDPLPGIPGDRRLTRDKIEKCILLSDTLPNEVADDPLSRQLEVVPEFFGLSSVDTGVIFRLLPQSGVLPLFSLYSMNRKAPHEVPVIVSHLQQIYRGDSAKIAAELGPQLARPLVESLLAGFRVGFSMEMHAQNTLCSLGKEVLVDRVYFRDLEGVVFSNTFRINRGMKPLFPSFSNHELLWEGNSMRPWFNRNLDHDLGRVFQSALDTLVRYGAIDHKEQGIAVSSIQKTVRHAVCAAGLQDINWPGRIFPCSRAPWGNGLRVGHYFSTRFR